jgi:iron complex outermembrane receptor protein
LTHRDRGWPLRAACATLLAGAVQGTAAGVVAPADPLNPAEALELPTVTVIGTTPLPGLATPIEDVPANVQVFSAAEMVRQHPTALSDYLTRNGASVNANSAQGNPFQPDLLFRGFTASPLLGTPQGVSVFQDGVRINEPFGDVVNWDLIPQSAISSVQLIPGSNPVFGLNTLGGALAIYTKSGAQYPGAELEATAGSFGRRTAQFEWGGARGAVDAFLTGVFYDDRGWADHNPSIVRQLFAKVGWQDERTDLDAALTVANNSLQGTQTLPLSFLGDIHQAYTWPDSNDDRLTLLTIKGSRFVAPWALLGGNTYYRYYRNTGLNSDVNHDYGQVDPISGAPDLVEAMNDVLNISEKGFGGGLQLTLTSRGSYPSQFNLGASIDVGETSFVQSSQPAGFNAERGTVATGASIGVSDAGSRSEHDGVFAAELLHLTPRLSLSVSGRYDRAEIRISDRSGLAPQLDGVHVFTRFNPAVGGNLNPVPGLTLYVGYTEGMRAPTAIELSCADPAAPCKLPNDFVSDPALAAEVARTLELGARGNWHGWQWSAAAYQSRLSNDIEFVSSAAGAGSVGYFANVGATRRSGVELTAATQRGALGLTARYSFIDATFQSAFAERSPDNSSADANGVIQVVPGDRLPGIARQTLKVRLDYRFAARCSLGVTLLGSAGVYARGDENNADRNGPVPGYVLASLDAIYQLSAPWQLFATVNNVFDSRYYDFGVLGENFFTAPGNAFGPSVGLPPRVEQFRGLGVPRGVWLGVRYGGGTAAGAGP